MRIFLYWVKVTLIFDVMVRSIHADLDILRSEVNFASGAGSLEGMRQLYVILSSYITIIIIIIFYLLLLLL